jgi:hypothetical protein
MLPQSARFQPSAPGPSRPAETIGGPPNPRYKEVTSALQKIHEANSVEPIGGGIHGYVEAAGARGPVAWCGGPPGMGARKTPARRSSVSVALVAPMRREPLSDGLTVRRSIATPSGSGRDSNRQPPGVRAEIGWSGDSGTWVRIPPSPSNCRPYERAGDRPLKRYPHPSEYRGSRCRSQKERACMHARPGGPR